MGDAAAARVAAILGGSGTHVVQIIIAIVVAATLIGYFLLRVLDDKRGREHLPASFRTSSIQLNGPPILPPAPP